MSEVLKYTVIGTLAFVVGFIMTDAAIGCEVEHTPTATAGCDYSSSSVNDGWGWNASTGQSCAPIVDVEADFSTVTEDWIVVPPAPVTIERCAVEALSVPAAQSKYGSHCEGQRKDCDTVSGITYCANFSNPRASTIGGRVTVPSAPVRTVVEQPRTVTPTVRPDPYTFNPIKGTRASNPSRNWMDSYSVGGRCFIDSTFDHAIGSVRVGGRTVRQIDALLKLTPDYRPRQAGDPIYNDVQCGNGPANNYGDEDWAGGCPGRVDLGRAGCGIIGPKWQL